MNHAHKDRRFRLHRCPQLLLLGWVVYFILYAMTERLIPLERCHLIHCALDDRIPFREEFALFYVGWYFLLAGSLVYFLQRDVPAFCKLQSYIIFVQLLATAVFILYPSRQALRPETFPRDNLLSALMGIIYRIDTPTGVFPSLHAAISIGIASAWLRRKETPKWRKVLVGLFCLGVCMSVAFVKQHSVLDILAAIPICLLAEWLIYHRGEA